MRIAYVVNARMPTDKAYGLQVMRMCTAFARVGHAVTLVVPRRENEIETSLWDYYGLEPAFRIEYVRSFDAIRFARVLKNAAFWLSAAAFGLRARRVLSRLRPDVVYARDVFAALWAPPGPRRVFEAHDFPSRHPALWKPLWRRYDRIVTVTDGLRRVFMERGGIPGERLFVAEDAVDLEEFSVAGSREEARAALGLPKDSFIAVYAGHLYPQKGAADALAAAETFKNGLVVIVGGPDADADKLRETARRAGIANAVIVGQVPRGRVPLYLKAADAAILPNRGGSEYDARYVSPLKLFEYQAAGLPILASDLPAIREVLDDETAVFFAPGDPSALASGLATLAASSRRRAELSEASFADARTRTWTERARKVLNGL